MDKFDVEARAHGRVNLIGEHTDYNDGYVLPTCIPQHTRVRLKRRDDREVIGVSENFGSHQRYTLGTEMLRQNWADYLQGVTQQLAAEGMPISGFECSIRSSVPVGSGLSSSAALEVALLRGLNELFRLGLDPIRIAQIGQNVENEFVGAHVGIMDQLVASVGRLGEASFIDTRDLRIVQLPLPLTEIELLVIDSGVAHSHSGGDYNTRRAECERACALLGIASLRELTCADSAKIDQLPEPYSRRARHVVTENQRVLDSVNALEARDFQRLGKLFLESHSSMRDDYAVSVPEIDLLVELAQRHEPVFGARLTGGGFGGSIVALVRAGFAAEVGEKIARDYSSQTRRQANILVPSHART